MKTTKLKVDIESDPFGLNVEGNKFNLDVLFQPFSKEDQSLINFYEESLVGEKKDLKRRVFKQIGFEDLENLERRLHSNREPLSKTLGWIEVDENLEIVNHDLNV